MNPQPNSNAVGITTILFILVYLAFVSDKKYHYKFRNSIPLAEITPPMVYSYVESGLRVTDRNIPHTPKNKKHQTTKPIKKKKSKPKKEYTQLQQDCMDALLSLGMKKREAKATLHSTFNKHKNIKEVQEFIYFALLKNPNT